MLDSSSLGSFSIEVIAEGGEKFPGLIIRPLCSIYQRYLFYVNVKGRRNEFLWIIYTYTDFGVCVGVMDFFVYVNPSLLHIILTFFFPIFFITFGPLRNI